MKFIAAFCLVAVLFTAGPALAKIKSPFLNDGSTSLSTNNRFHSKNALVRDIRNSMKTHIEDETGYNGDDGRGQNINKVKKKFKNNHGNKRLNQRGHKAKTPQTTTNE